jgi:hypothetical protein
MDEAPETWALIARSPDGYFSFGAHETHMTEARRAAFHAEAEARGCWVARERLGDATWRDFRVPTEEELRGALRGPQPPRPATDKP